MNVFEQNAAMRAALDKIYHLRQIDWEPTRVCGIINQCIMAIGAPVAAPQVAAKLPKWIDDKKGSDPLVDDLIAYIEQIAAPQVVADERALSLLSGISRTIISLRDGWGDKNDADEAIANIAEVKSALAAAPVQAQEPVAWLYEAFMDVNGDAFWMKALTEQDPRNKGCRVRNVKALHYATPDERAQGVRITPTEILSYGAIKTGSPTSAKEENAKSIEDGRVKVTQCVFATSPTNPGVLVSAPMLGPERAAFNDLVAKYPVKSRQDAEDFFVFGIQHQKMAAPAAQGDKK